MRALIAGLVTLTFLAACAPPPPMDDKLIEQISYELMTVPVCMAKGYTMDPQASVARLDALKVRMASTAKAEDVARIQQSMATKYDYNARATRDECTIFSMNAISEANKKRDAAAQAAIDAQASASRAQINAMNNNGAALIQAIGNNRQCIHTSWNNSVSCI